MYQYKARLSGSVEESIYDGDTIKICVDLGFGLYFNLGSCRLLGIDAPEIRGIERPNGLITRDYVRSVFKDIEYFTINTRKDTSDKYGRYLVEIILPDGTNLNQSLVLLNLATPY